MSNQETNLQREIMLELSKYGMVIRQQSGKFRVIDNLEAVIKYGAKPKIRYIKCGFTGISDLQFLSDDGNLTVFIETKTETGVVSEEQEKFINFINSKKSKHLKAGVARSIDEALKLIGVK